MFRNTLTTLLLLIGFSVFAYGQNAQIQGKITDSSGALVPKALVRIVDQQTNTEYNTHSNSAGAYVISGLTPSLYTVSVKASGFNVAVSNVVTLNVGQNATLDFALKVGSETTEVVVNADNAAINTSDGSVSTVVGQELVRDMPLNGRTFQNLIMMSPGIVSSSPQGNDLGGFSVNGSRTNANYYIVDDVSAMNMAYDWGGTSSSGMSASASAIGTTQSVLPVDALQEFRITTSSYTAEHGRQSGAQISIQSRSGTNTFHGDLYDYLRNSVFDANDWFNTYTTPVIPRSAERQNDFGGALGGPISIPHLFSGTNRLFFFGAYEGLRLSLPLNATIYYVPSNGTYNTSSAYANPIYKNIRANSPAAVQPVFNAFPLPNCSTAQNPQCVDYGDGLSPYLFSGSYPARINAIDFRVDAQVFPGTRIFVRYSDAPTDEVTHITTAPALDERSMRTRVYLLGADTTIRNSLTNELRLQYSPSSFVQTFNQDLTGGAQAANLNTLQGLPPVGGESFVELDFKNGDISKLYSLHYGTMQFQSNAVDTIRWTHGTHFFSAGADYRQTTTYLDDGQISRTPGAFTYFDSAAQMTKNDAAMIKTNSAGRQNVIAKNLGLFVQDQWRTTSRLTLNLGLRWDYNPSPTITGAQQYTYTGNVNNPSSLALSALGAPLYQNTYTNFQPRFGAALAIHREPGHETVLRVGAGLFYDLIALNEFVGSGSSLGPGNEVTFKAVAFPLSAAVIEAPPTLPPAAPYVLDFVADPKLISPSTIHWNVSLEQALGNNQTLTLGYVGSEGRNLIDETEYSLSALNPLFTTIDQYQNGPSSNYNSLQASYRYRATRRLQFMASYTWAHAIDWSSNDDNIEPLQRGNSNHDVRSSFSSALVYNVPSFFQNHLARSLASNWNVDLLTVSRSAFPVEQAGATVVDPATGNEYVSTLNYNGQNPYVQVAGIPGGRQLNPAVFSVPTANQTYGNAPRNFLRGFGESAFDTALQRTFPLHHELGIVIRAEAFNVFNHPNFGAVNVSCGATAAGAVCNNPLMGQAKNTLSTALGSNTAAGGMSSIYQLGGPRALQFMMKLQF